MLDISLPLPRTPFFLLTLLICLHPVEKQHLRPQGGVLQPCHSIGQLDDALQLYGVNRSKRGLILRLGCRIRLRDEMQFQELILPFSVTVDVEIDGLAPVTECLITNSDRFLGCLGVFIAFAIVVSFIKDLFLIKHFVL